MNNRLGIARCSAAATLLFVMFIGMMSRPAGSAPRRQNDAADQPFDLDNTPAGYDNLYRELQGLFRRFYPQMTSHQLGPEMHFEFSTRIFLIHLPTKMGEWQDPSPIRGPLKGGIHCDITIARGKWTGAAVVPQDFNRFYFVSHLYAPHDETRDLFLQVHLDTPADFSPEFLAAFTERVNTFGQYLK